MRPWRTVQTYTVTVNVKEWMHGSAEPTKNLLLSFLTDIAEQQSFIGICSACAVESQPLLQFTFTSDVDRQTFETILEEIWQDHWLAV